MENSLKVGRHFYSIKTEHFSLEYGDSVKKVKTLENLIYFSNLKSASFNSSDLNDEGLAFLSNLSQLENLNLQDTNISDEGIKNLTKLKNLKYLRLKENAQLTDDCVQYLIGIEALEDLQIQETSITQKGLDQLTALKNLKNIVLDVWKNNFTQEALLALSEKMPDCSILAKGKGEFKNGSFEGIWKM